ncbi:MAG: hypothetical protein QMD85_02820 [Candidatus Aenigmarchaeota archaeon]|nr:hypothetical protein [Candidatus Aenigmarchaeota archaeon]MDI6722481.1 hypothetical protein [Candidatus Aenigmarchaeota archaeon]
MVLKRIAGPVLFLFSKRRNVFKLRKRYDRIREKANKLRDVQKRNAVFSVLDQIEPNLNILEEQNVSRFERSRMMKYVAAGLKKADEIRKSKQK